MERKQSPLCLPWVVWKCCGGDEWPLRWRCGDKSKVASNGRKGPFPLPITPPPDPLALPISSPSSRPTRRPLSRSVALPESPRQGCGVLGRGRCGWWSLMDGSQSRCGHRRGDRRRAAGFGTAAGRLVEASMERRGGCTALGRQRVRHTHRGHPWHPQDPGKGPGGRRVRKRRSGSSGSRGPSAPARHKSPNDGKVRLASTSTWRSRFYCRA